MACKTPEAIARQRERTRQWKAANPEAVRQHNREAARRYREKNREKVKARYTLHTELRAGRMQVQPCEQCGARGEAHHENYSKPLEVRWLCKIHHESLHHS